MIITSKIRKLYKLKLILGFSLAFLILIVCGYLSFGDVSLNYKVQFLFIGFFIIALCCFVLSDVLSIFKITVNPNQIEKKSILFGKQEVILYTEIENIILERRKLYGKSGYINDGYLVSIIKLKSNNRIIISPDQFENYTEIMNAVKDNLNNKHEA